MIVEVIYNMTTILGKGDNGISLANFNIYMGYGDKFTYSGNGA